MIDIIPTLAKLNQYCKNGVSEQFVFKTDDPQVNLNNEYRTIQS